MYTSLEEAWSEPLMVASEAGFSLNPSYHPSFLPSSSSAQKQARSATQMPELSPPRPPVIPVPEPISLPPPSKPIQYVREPMYTPYPISPMVEGFSGGPNTPKRDEIRAELQRLRDEIAWLRQDRYDMQKKIDLLCFVCGGIALLLLADWARKLSQK